MYDERRRPSVVTAAAVLLYISGGASVLIGLLGLSVSNGLNLLVIGLLAWNRDAQEYFRTESW